MSKDRKFGKSMILSILLVLTLSFFSLSLLQTSYAEGEEIRDVSFNGEDGIQFVLRNDDNVNVSMYAKVPGVSLINGGDPNSVFGATITISGREYKFDRCEPREGDEFFCTFNKRLQITNINPEVTILLYNTPTTPIYRLDLEDVVVDNGKPKTTLNSVGQGFTSSQLILNYAVQEKACETCGTNICSGLSKIEITDALGEVIQEIDTTSSGTRQCTQAESYVLPASTLGSEGSFTLCIKATDVLGYSSSMSEASCKTFTIDTTLPGVLNDGIYDSTGNFKLTHLNGNVDVMFKLQISEPGITKENAIADLSQLGGSAQQQASSCTTNLESTECKWEGLLLTEGTETVTVSATIKDNAGNEFPYSNTFTFEVDTDAPEFIELFSNNNEEYLNGNNDVITAVFRELGSGLNRKNVFIDITQFDISESRKQPDSCVQNGPNWDCVWNFSNLLQDNNVESGDDITIRFEEITDDLGNEGDTTNSRTTLTYDNTAPELNGEIIIAPKEGNRQSIVEGDVIIITAEFIEEHSGIDESSAILSTSVFTDGGDYLEANECLDLENGIFRCTWEYAGPLDNTRFEEVNIQVKDLAGNLFNNDGRDIDLGRDVDVVNYIEDLTDFWKNTRSVNTLFDNDENFISRNTLVLLGGGQMASFVVMPDASSQGESINPYVLEFSIPQCFAKPDGDQLAEWNDIEILDKIDLGEEQQNGLYDKGKLLLVELPSLEEEIAVQSSYYKIKCEAEIYQAKSEFGDVYKNKEKMNFTYDLPIMFTLEEAPDKKALDALNETKGIINAFSTITDILEGIINVWGGICNLVNSVRQISSGFCGVIIPIQAITGNQAWQACDSLMNFWGNLWYGGLGDLDDIGEDPSQFDYGRGEHSDIGLFDSSKDTDSLGFWCDLVLCEECQAQWDEALPIGDAFDSFNTGLVSEALGDYSSPAIYGDERATDLGLSENGGSARSFPFPYNPHNNAFIALTCAPTCLPGVYNTLEYWELVLQDKEACRRRAFIFGYSMDQCDEFVETARCAYFWGGYVGAPLDNILSNLATDLLTRLVEATLFKRQCFDSTCAMEKTVRNLVLAINALNSATDTVTAIADTYNLIDGWVGDDKEDETDEAAEGASRPNSLGNSYNPGNDGSAFGGRTVGGIRQG